MSASSRVVAIARGNFARQAASLPGVYVLSCEGRRKGERYSIRVVADRREQKGIEFGAEKRELGAGCLSDCFRKHGLRFLCGQGNVRPYRELRQTRKLLT